jgi:hypothetical protein
MAAKVPFRTRNIWKIMLTNTQSGTTHSSAANTCIHKRRLTWAQSNQASVAAAEDRRQHEIHTHFWLWALDSSRCSAPACNCCQIAGDGSGMPSHAKSCAAGARKNGGQSLEAPINSDSLMGMMHM